MSSWTGSLCPENGAYWAGCQCGVLLHFSRGDHFPVCPTCRMHVPWSAGSKSTSNRMLPYVAERPSSRPGRRASPGSNGTEPRFGRPPPRTD